ncbi:hypothetical protein ACHAQJ_006231 [Trichoderma viride]
MDSDHRRGHSLHRRLPMDAADAMTMLFLASSIVAFIFLVVIWVMATVRPRPAAKVHQKDDSRQVSLESENETRGLASGVEAGSVPTRYLAK